MDYIDLLQLLKAHGGTLQKVKVYGYISARLPKPSNLLSSCALRENGIFVRMDLLAVDLSYYAQFLKEKGIYNKSNKYFVNGSICMYVNSRNKFPDWYCSFGTLRIGSKQCDNYVVLFDFRKNNNNWIIEQNRLDDIEYRAEFGEGSALCNYILGTGGKPTGLDSMPKLSCVLPETAPFKDKVTLQSSKTSSEEKPRKRESHEGILYGALDEIDRNEVADFSSKYSEYMDICYKATEKLNSSISSLVEKYSVGGTEYIIDLAENLNKNKRFKPESTAMTGKAILKEYLSQFGSMSKAKYCGVSCTEFIIDYFDQVVEYIKYDITPDFQKEVLSLFEAAFQDKELFYCNILGIITRVNFGNSADILSRRGISFSNIVRSNPYALFAMGLISFKDAELLALCFNLVDSKTLFRYRNMCLLHDKISSQDVNDTLFMKEGIIGDGLPTRLTTARVNKGLPLRIIKNIQYFVTNEEVRDYDFKGWSQSNYYVTKYVPRNYIELAIRDSQEYGLGVELDSKYLTSTKLLEKELFVYDTLWNMGNTETGVSSELIDTYIDEYEEYIGFKLEKEQRKAVHLLEHESGVTTGGAGSGKTTTVNCMVYVQRKLDSAFSIKYGAPTGKAAKVLQGVVKEPVKTMHSLCRLKEESDNLLDMEDDADAAEASSIYFFDEMSMVTIDLIYRVLKKVGDARLYFIGDVHQLNAIGKGMVLKNLLRFLPCVFLKVSKRSADNSGITLNSKLVNSNELAPLQDKSDFIRIPCADDMIKGIVVDICKHYLNISKTSGYSLPNIEVDKDDIQVVSPFVKETYSWGATKLNRELQPLFNKNGNYNDRFWTGYNYFIKGDRVIHTKLNMGDMQWYSSYAGGTFQKIYGCGIANGEVGKLVGFMHSSNCSFVDEVDDMPDGFKYPSSLRKDSSYVGYFVIVEYYDYMEDRPFYILYRVSNYDDPEYGLKLYDKDIKYLELFYAGSVHKLQGSQSKVVICCLGTGRGKGFLTRNMLYTMITRGSDLVILVGSVDDSPNSQLTLSRKDIADEGVLTIGELIARG